MEAEVVAFVVEVAVIVLIMALALYALQWFLDVSKNCWWDVQNCPLNPIVRRILNSTVGV